MGAAVGADVVGALVGTAVSLTWHAVCWDCGMSGLHGGRTSRHGGLFQGATERSHTGRAVGGGGVGVGREVVGGGGRVGVAVGIGVVGRWVGTGVGGFSHGGCA